jgi:hypothetical protein
MQWVDELGDYAVMIRGKVMTVPGEQFVTRRRACAMIEYDAGTGFRTGRHQ